MFGLTKLWNALHRLAAAIEATADTVDEVNVSLRSRLTLDAADGEMPDALAERMTVDALANGHADEEKPKRKGGRGSKAKS